ncbi:MAG: PEP-CTERM sorting domain-containing protein [Acidobacteria bacterium]|nr:PEP-CTERM sorting domain-containing protein [Acidobacteriota bacterium]
MSSPARADIIFYFHAPGAINASDNLLFNADGLALEGLTVQGITQSGTLLDITGNELLTAGGGQATVGAQDGAFTWLWFEPNSLGVLFELFEANLAVYHTTGPPPTGTVTVNVVNNFGVTESGAFQVGPGNNNFSMKALDPQLMRSIEISSTIPLEYIRQIRLDGIQTPTSTPPGDVPEAGTLLLFGMGLLVVSRQLRRGVTRTV